MTTARGIDAADSEACDHGETATEPGHGGAPTSFRINGEDDEAEDEDEIGFECPCCRLR